MFRIEKERVNLAEKAVVHINIPSFPLMQDDENDDLAAISPNNQIDLAALEDEAKLKAAKIIDEAKEKAATILADAEEKAMALQEQARQEAYEQGLSRGLNDGLEQGLAEGIAQGKQEYDQGLAAIAAEIENALNQIARTKEDFIAEYDEKIIDLALYIAQKVLDYELYKSDQALYSIISNALTKMNHETKIVIRVSEKIASIFFSSEKAVFNLADGQVEARIIADSQLEDGDLHLESAGESIEAGINAQLKNIAILFNRKS